MVPSKPLRALGPLCALLVAACNQLVAGGQGADDDDTLRSGGLTCCDDRDNVVDCASDQQIALCSAGCDYVGPSDNYAVCTGTEGATYCNASGNLVGSTAKELAHCVFGCHAVSASSAVCCSSASDPACTAAKCTTGTAKAGCMYTDAASGRTYVGQQACQPDGTYGGACTACSTSSPPIGFETCTAPPPATGCTQGQTDTCKYTVDGKSYDGLKTCGSNGQYGTCAQCPSGVTQVAGVTCTKPTTGGTCTNGTQRTCKYTSGGKTYDGAQTCQNGSYGSCGPCPSGTVSLDGVVCSFPPSGTSCSSTQCLQGGNCYPLEEYNECCATQLSHHVKRLRASDGSCTYDVGACNQPEPASTCP
jgi:hypothetical protein